MWNTTDSENIHPTTAAANNSSAPQSDFVEFQVQNEHQHVASSTGQEQTSDDKNDLFITNPDAADEFHLHVQISPQIPILGLSKKTVVGEQQFQSFTDEDHKMLDESAALDDPRRDEVQKVSNVKHQGADESQFLTGFNQGIDSFHEQMNLQSSSHDQSSDDVQSHLHMKLSNSTPPQDIDDLKALSEALGQDGIQTSSDTELRGGPVSEQFRDTNKHSDEEEDISGVDGLESGELLPGTDLSGILSQNKWRAKLYQLNNKGSWDDYGTGEFQVIRDVRSTSFQSVCQQESDNEYYLLLVSEEDQNELLKTKIQASSSFSRQRDTIITWMDDDSNVDFALSFQESKGSQETWEIICSIQGKDHNSNNTQGEMGYHGNGDGANGNGSPNHDENDLPLPTYDNLQQIVNELSSTVGDVLKKRRICSQILQDNYQFLRKMVEIFETSEEMENFESLFNLFYITKYMLQLGDNKLIEVLLSNEFYLTIFGCLECKIGSNHQTLIYIDDPELSNPNHTPSGSESSQHNGRFEEAKKDEGISNNKLNHRDFLLNKVKFKKIVKIDSEEITNTIHLVYRLHYLKDTAIARFIEDSVLQNINSLVYVNSQDIVTHILQNKEILAELLTKMRSSEMHTKHDAIEFFMEVCQMTKNMQIHARYNFFESMNSTPSFNLIEILTESFNLFYPDQVTLKAEAFEENEGLVEYLVQMTKPQNDTDSLDYIRTTILDFLKPHDKYDIKKLDLLKINAIEILMNISQFTPSASIRTFILCEDQRSKGYPFIKRLTSHLLYSYEQGLKIQVFEFFKLLLDNEQPEKKVEFNDLFYRDTMMTFLNFLSTVEDLNPIPLDQGDETNSSSQLQMKYVQNYNKSLEYSRSIVVQLMTKCAQEHAFRFRIFAVQQETIEKITRLQRFHSKLLNLWIVKFYKAIIKAKDEAFVIYLIKKNLLKTIVDIFLENSSKTNLLHSCILELFDYLTQETNKKISGNFIQNYSEALFKNPQYEKYFRAFVNHFEGKPNVTGGSYSNSLSQRVGSSTLGNSNSALLLPDSILPVKRFKKTYDSDDSEEEDEQSNNSKSSNDEEDEKHNQEAFQRYKQLSSNGDQSHHSLLQILKNRRKSSSDQSSSEEEDEMDMGIHLAKKGISPTHSNSSSSDIDKNSPSQIEKQQQKYSHLSRIYSQPKHDIMPRTIEFQLDNQQPEPQFSPKGELQQNDDFVLGPTLVNPVTGEEKDDDSSFADLERSVKTKRQKKDENDQEMGWEY